MNRNLRGYDVKIMVTGGAIIRDTQGRVLLQRTVDLEGKTADQGLRLIYQDANHESLQLEFKDLK